MPSRMVVEFIMYLHPSLGRALVFCFLPLSGDKQGHEHAPHLLFSILQHWYHFIWGEPVRGDHILSLSAGPISSCLKGEACSHLGEVFIDGFINDTCAYEQNSLNLESVISCLLLFLLLFVFPSRFRFRGLVLNMETNSMMVKARGAPFVKFT
ncbi:hypothetical protein AWENTII_005796 [Aspergillus wentii]